VLVQANDAPFSGVLLCRRNYGVKQLLIDERQSEWVVLIAWIRCRHLK
jgi:hypothetical protein